MNLIDNFKSMFSPKKSLKDLRVDDLNMEKIRLEQTERKLVAEIDDIESEKKGLFLKGKDESAARKQVIIARHIKELDVKAQNIDKNLSFISRQARIINGFIQVKENEKLMAQSGLSSTLATIDLATLQQYVEKASIDGVFHMDKLSEILGTLEQGERLSSIPGATEESDISDIVAQMQRAKESESDPTAVDEAFNKMNTSIRAKEPGEKD